MIALLTLLACGPGTDEASLAIDCLGMMHSPMAGTSWASIQSAAPTVDQATGAAIKRCAWVGSRELNAGVSVMSTMETTEANGMTPIFYFNGETWRALSGSLEFDRLDSPRKASGTYTVQAVPLESFSSTENFTVSGAFSWCDYLIEEDCPDTPVDPLEDRFELSAPHLGTTSGGLSQCSMVWDRDAEAFIFDMQFGTVSGLNVGRLLADECGGGVSTLPPNRLTFKAAGVTGPGTYGPMVAENQPGGLLPSLEATRPQALDSATALDSRCSVFPYETVTASGPGSACTFSFDEQSVQIDCDDVVERASLSAPNTFEVSGALSLRADCVLTER